MFDRTYVINLKRRTDKRLHMEREIDRLSKVGINLNHCFFDAVDGNDDDIFTKYQFKTPQNPKWSDPNSGKTITNGEIGCALSHYLIWKEIVELVEKKELDPDCKILILEDDIVFQNDFQTKYHDYISELTKPFDMLYLHRKPLELENEIKFSTHINVSLRSYWTCAYVLTCTGAKKLMGSNYLDNLIPVDEFMIIMYGGQVYGFEELFEEYEKINCYATCPSLLKLTDDAFYDSETFHSNPFNDNQSYHFNENNDFTILYIGPKIGDSYQRFVEYTKLYAYPLISIDANQKNESEMVLLEKELSSWSQKKLESTLMLVITVPPEHFANVIPITSPTEVIEKYHTLSQSNRDIVTVKRGFDTTKSLCCGWAFRILEFVQQIENNDLTLSQLLVISSLMTTEIIRDENCLIFQLLDNKNYVNFNHRKSRVINPVSNKMPCLVFANNSGVLINQVENYTGNGWNEYYGYRALSSVVCKPKIYLSFHSKNKETENFLNILDYPEDRLLVNYLSTGKENEEELLRKGVELFLSSDCSYYFFVGRGAVLENGSVLIQLLSINKGIVTPLLRRGKESWTNFWGELDDHGYYARSFDYFDIINNRRQGYWNVPYVTETYLFRRDILEQRTDIFNNKELDVDMRICHYLRNSDLFMYVVNLSYYGYLRETSKETSSEVVDLNQEVTLYDIFTRREEWEKKYLHPDYYLNRYHLEKMIYQELCHDIFNFSLFSPIFCTELINKMEQYGKWSKGKNEHHDSRLGKDYYENVPTVDTQLFEIDFDKQWKEIVFSYIAPICELLYNNYQTKGINISFVVRYNYQEQTMLKPHHDSSTYTVNIALNSGNGVDYSGGGCRFIRHDYVLKNQEPGKCCIHPGRLTAYHEGLPVTDGTRYILVSFIN